MTRTFFILIFFCLTFFNCKSQQAIEQFISDDLGITVEKFDTINLNDNRYNENNKIYKVGKRFTFTYYYEDKLGDKYLVTKSALNDKNTYDWVFENINKKNKNSIYQIILSVNSGLSPFIQNIPDYNQTVITYNFKLINGEFWNNEMTGVVENKMNLWMHPPRTDFFKILELNPFPYIKSPYKIGNKWTWKLEFGDHWADKKWLLWKGKNENKYIYKITDYKTILTKIGNLKCYVIISNANSNLGQTKLISYFNEDFGFVKLDYINIDGTKTFLELESVE